MHRSSEYIGKKEDVMSTTSAPDWEQSKENAAPLERGRNIQRLEHVGLHMATEEKNRELSRLERLVRPSEQSDYVEVPDGEDPLEHWLSFIKFSQDAFPSDSNQQFLLMERCTRALIKVPQYANDDRFVGVCAKYADKTNDASAIFKYLHQQKVGQKCALFWIAWAFVAEKSGDFPFAEQAFKKGISKKAEPMAILLNRHKQFQRRMSKYWLNSAQANDSSVDEQPNQRQALGGLSRRRLQDNDRRARSSSNRQSTWSIAGSSQSSHSNKAAAFPIFVEQKENEPGYNLEPSSSESDRKRVIETQEDRRKENLQKVERWNERGVGLERGPSFGQRPSSAGPAVAPFSVFVDEECAVQHKRNEEEKLRGEQRHKRARDDRMLRERPTEGVAEKLTMDPLRYLKNPAKWESDHANVAGPTGAVEEGANPQPTKKSSRAKIAFDKHLMKDEHGQEQCFEEARMKSKYYTLVPPTIHFNLLRENEPSKASDSHMDTDDDDDDVCMTSLVESTNNSVVQGSASRPPTHDSQARMGDLATSTQKVPRVLFKGENSLEATLNKSGVSQASSTIDPALAVGMPVGREEETINTKLAMKELSMMFSSPGMTVFDSNSKMNRSYRNTDPHRTRSDANISYDNMLELVGHMNPDNSLLAVQESDENEGVTPNEDARPADHPGLDKQALRELQSSSAGTNDPLSCHQQTGRLIQVEQAQPIPTSLPNAGPTTGFTIFEDAPPRNISLPTSGSAAGFTIFEDAPPEHQSSSPIQHNEKSSFSIYQDSPNNGGRNVNSQGSAHFPIYDEKDGPKQAKHMMITQADDRTSTPPPKSASTKVGTGSFSIFVDTDTGNGLADHDDDDDTVSPTKFGDFLREVDEKMKKDKGSDGETSAMPKVRESVYDYNRIHAQNLQHADQLSKSLAACTNISCSKDSLCLLMSTPGANYSFLDRSLPRDLRSRRAKKNHDISIGVHAGKIVCELGRGSFGIVVLLKDLSSWRTLALKSQPSRDCLAWECEVLRRVQSRLDHTLENDDAGYPFPRPLSFMALADGGLFAMSAVSSSGSNLLDLVNIHKRSIGDPIPETLSMLYTSRILRTLQFLHCHARVLHCDIKPDNFVLCPCEEPNHPLKHIEGSDLMLVDFGCAVDLEELARESCSSGNFAEVKLSGNPTADAGMACSAMRTNQSWSFDADLYGVACCAHVLLYGTHMEIMQGDDTRWKPKARLRRYWNTDLWQHVFDSLLNPTNGGTAYFRLVKDLRVRLDREVQARVETLKDQLRRQANFLPC